MWQLQRHAVAVKKMPTVDWIRGKVVHKCTDRKTLMFVMPLMCDREALNSLVRVFVFSCVLVCQIQVTQEF